MEAAGATLRGAGAVLGSGNLAGRAMSGIGLALDMAAHKPERSRRAPRKPLAQSSTSGLAPHEAEGYREALDDVRRDLTESVEAAGLDLGAIEHEAMAPVWAAAQHQPLTSIARQAGFGDRESPRAMVSDFVAYRLEGQLMAQGVLGERVTRPGRRPTTPLTDHPTLLDYDRGQQLRWATGGGDMGTYAGLHHAIRSHAITPQAGFDAAGGFYDAALETGSVAGAIEAARQHAASAVVPSERLNPWIRRLEQQG